MTRQTMLTVQAQVAGASRIETLMGQDYRVVPAVLVRSQVLNNNLGATFLPPEEITPAWAQVWNGIPVVAGDHPKVRGWPVSARTPSILNARGIGFLFGAQVEEEGDGVRRLSAEVWLNLSRAEAVAELQTILEKVDKGEPVELSTGFPTQVVEAQGAYNGKAYELVLRPQGADHLAVFTDGLGACSTTDGCGLGVNHAGPCQTAAPAGEGTTLNAPQSDEGGAPRVPAPARAVNEDAAPAKSWLRRMVDRFAQAFQAEPGPGAANESDEDRRRLLSTALRERFGGEKTYVWVEAVYSEDGYVVFELESEDEAGLFRIDYEISDQGEVAFTTDPVEVRRITTYEPVATNAGETEGGAMSREEMIAQLAQAGPLSAESLNKLTDCELSALLSNQAASASASGQGDQGADTTSAVSAEEVSALRAEITSLKDKLASLEQVTAPAVQQQVQERQALVDELAGNARIAANWTREDLEAMPTESLRKIRALSRGESYAGRGGPQVSTNASASPQYAEPRPYWVTNQAQSSAAGKES